MRKGKHASYRRIRADSGQHRRIRIVMAVLGAAAFLPVLVRLSLLMVASYDAYSALALANQSRTTQVQSPRGVIYDRNMNILAGSETVENVYIDPRELQQTGTDIDDMARTLARILEVDESRVKKLAGDRSLRYHLIAPRVPEQTAAEIRAYIEKSEIEGIHLEPDSKRYYPYGSLAAQVIGFTNASNDGAEGIEAAYDAFLSGSGGKTVTTKGNNEMDMPFSVERYLTGTAGADLVTTLDVTVQMALENQMQLAIERYDVQNGAFGIVMDVDTGEILAMATLGSYDPNQYLEIGDADVEAELESLRLDYLRYPEDSPEYTGKKAKYRDALVAARLKQWRNRCISDGYEPGSTFKTITLAAAIDCGAVTENTRFACSGAEQIPGRSQLLHCWRSQGHGGQVTAQALQNSCNLAFAHIGLKLGGERFYEYVKNFGILEKTGIDLAGESGGVFFSKELITDTDKWGTASLTSGSFGQTFKITPLQLVRAVAAVVNGGKLLEPYIVSEVIDAEGNTLLKQEPTVLGTPISEETSRIMCGMIESVVTEGTAKNAAVAGFRVGGKTGTSEKIDVFDENGQRVRDKIVSFVGLAPMDDPRYIILVGLDTPSPSTGIYISGGVMAAPTVGAVMADILPYLEVPRAEEPVFTEVPDLTGLTSKEVQNVLTDAGLTPSVQGTGETVTAQLPGSGTTLEQGSQVLVYFGEDMPETVTVPDFTGMTPAQAAQAANKAGVTIRFAGNPDLNHPIQVQLQDIPPQTAAAPGSTVTITFTDPTARD
ncbi:MAG: PASTA domain-containing protein [Oscillospiraceae bacterium]|nr:PASTA domain-containing protein [Oscillospiraceae bacterium]